MGSTSTLRSVGEVASDAKAWSRSASPTVRVTRGVGSTRPVASYLVHAYGTNLQFDGGDFSFVKLPAEQGTKRAFELRDAHFEIPEP